MTRRQIADPFDEDTPLPLTRRCVVLGQVVEFRTHDAAWLALVDAAYGGLPAAVMQPEAPALRVDLFVQDAAPTWPQGAAPPAPQMLGGAGVRGALLDANHAALAVLDTGRAVVRLSRALLAHSYHARYEFLEFAVYVLAQHARGMLPLHAGCVALGDAAVLIVGDSGAGKSTLSLLALAEGLQFLTEDSCFVDPASLDVVGVPNFLHLRFDALDWLQDAAWRERVQASAVIHRRSGVAKWELDMRGGWAPLAAGLPVLRHLVFASSRPAGEQPLLRSLGTDEVLARLRDTQPYGARHAGWAAFEHTLAGVQGWELRRGAHARQGAQALAALFKLPAPR
jgi:hypothetical protein